MNISLIETLTEVNLPGENCTPFLMVQLRAIGQRDRLAADDRQLGSTNTTAGWLTAAASFAASASQGRMVMAAEACSQLMAGEHKASRVGHAVLNRSRPRTLPLLLDKPGETHRCNQIASPWSRDKA
jgi:hypothetical protein